MMYEEEKVDKISIGNLKKVLDVEEVCTVQEENPRSND